MRPFPRRASFALSLVPLAAAIALAGCTALNQMSEGIADTAQEFGGKKPKVETSGTDQPVTKELDASALTFFLNGEEVGAAPEGEAYYTFSEPVAVPTTFSFALPDEEAYGKFEYALVNVTKLEGGVAKTPNRTIYSEKKGRASALYPGAEIDLREPDGEAFKVIVGGYPFDYNHYYEAGQEYEIEVRAMGTKGAATRRARFATAP